MRRKGIVSYSGGRAAPIPPPLPFFYIVYNSTTVVCASPSLLIDLLSPSSPHIECVVHPSKSFLFVACAFTYLLGRREERSFLFSSHSMPSSPRSPLLHTSPPRPPPSKSTNHTSPEIERRGSTRTFCFPFLSYLLSPPSLITASRSLSLSSLPHFLFPYSSFSLFYLPFLPSPRLPPSVSSFPQHLLLINCILLVDLHIMDDRGKGKGMDRYRPSYSSSKSSSGYPGHPGQNHSFPSHPSQAQRRRPPSRDPRPAPAGHPMDANGPGPLYWPPPGPPRRYDGPPLEPLGNDDHPSMRYSSSRPVSPESGGRVRSVSMMDSARWPDDRGPLIPPFQVCPFPSSSSSFSFSSSSV